jgi:MFS family permease
LVGISGACVIILGGYIATVFSRKTVILIQSIGMFILTSFSLLLVKDFSGDSESEKNYQDYFPLLKKGLIFSFFKRYMCFFTLSICLWNITWKIWMEMIIFFIYFGYTGSDFGSGIIRFVGWIITSIFAGMAGTWSKRLDSRKFLPLLNFISATSFFGFFAFLIISFPLSNHFSVIPIVLIICFLCLFSPLLNIFVILRQRLILDIVPDSIRNSIYSLYPTLTLLIGVPFLYTSGNIIELYSIPFMLILLGGIGFISSLFMFLFINFLPSNILLRLGKIPKSLGKRK